MLEFVKGDLFDAAADVRVNTVNCVGVMGAGVALAFKQRYPEMFRDYQRDCKNGLVKPGIMHVWKSLSGDWIINFPTKRDWRDPSRYEDIEAGLDNLRSYLEGIGSVTIALPALGCGHGGLDWNRVSQMIRDKLNGVDAHVLVFEPAASQRAGRSVIEQPTADEQKSVEQLGYKLVERHGFPDLVTTGPLYLKGRSEALSRKWIALVPSREPAERELQALRMIAAELARSLSDKNVALVHGTRASEEVASIFLRQGIEVVMLLPFGVLTRKALAKQSGRTEAGSLSLASTAPPNGKWSRKIFAQTIDLLRQNADGVLLSDPEPDWLVGKGLTQWGKAPISYVRYETTSGSLRDALERVGARAIGRRGEDGAPKIDFLIGKNSALTDASKDAHTRESSGAESLSESSAGCSPQGCQYAFAVEADGKSSVSLRKIFDSLTQMNSSRLSITVKLSADASDEDRRQLLNLGFKRL